MDCTGLKLIKKTVKILRKALRYCEKIVCDEEEDDIEYIKDNINELKNLKNTYFDRNKYHGYRAKYLGTDETIKYLFKDDEEDLTYTRSINNISHFLTRLYYHLMSI